MKATELMLGNYYTFEGKEYQWTISDFYSEQEAGILDECKPIPLTEQWLKDFGSKYDPAWEKSVWHFDKIKISQSEAVKPHFMLRDYHWQAGQRIEYVHQLQNLYFALTGKELTK